MWTVPESIRPALLVSLQRAASSVVVHLGDLPGDIEKVNLGLLELDGGRTLDDGAASALGSHIFRLFVRMTLMASLLEQIEIEAETGRPVNRTIALCICT